ncbi:MAG: hypothetical protein EGR90_00020 [Lachnospiraceae bacterium]|nr:hypothetical protein [Lachnospiraceae bacterium]
MESEVHVIVEILGFLGFLLFVLGAGAADSESIVPLVMFLIGLVLMLIAAHESGVIKRWVTSFWKKPD